MDGTIIWKVNCATKHGVDTVLVKADTEPTSKQLNKIYKRMLEDFNIDKDDERCYVELGGCIDVRDIPFIEDYIKQENL